MIRVCLVDDQQLVRHGLRAVLERAPHIEVVGEARDGREAIRAAGQLAPDVIIMDVVMPVLDGLTATEFIKQYSHAPKVLILSGNDCFDDVERAKRAGADGFLTKNTGYGDLVEAIQAVNDGNSFFPEGEQIIPCL